MDNISEEFDDWVEIQSPNISPKNDNFFIDSPNSPPINHEILLPIGNWASNYEEEQLPPLSSLSSSISLSSSSSDGDIGNGGDDFKEDDSGRIRIIDGLGSLRDKIWGIGSMVKRNFGVCNKSGRNGLLCATTAGFGGFLLILFLYKLRIRRKQLLESKQNLMFLIKEKDQVHYNSSFLFWSALLVELIYFLT